MKNHVQLLLLLTMLISCSQQLSPFLDKVLNDLNRHSYFVAIDIKSATYSGRVVVENDDLYYCLFQKKHLSERSYKNLIANSLRNNEPLDVQDIDLEKWNIKKVQYIRSVTKSAEGGIDVFLKNYFDGKVLKDGITGDERTAIINQLFEWNIAAKIDDETGYLILVTQEDAHLP